jgi:uncharacterized protein with NRDE domain
MCTLAVFRNVTPRWPLVVAANRDEFYARPTAAPGPLDAPRGVVAGRDLEAGGTWLGLATAGRPFVAALLNRREADQPARPTAPGQRSRGLLCMDVLAAPDLDAAVQVARGLDASDYAGFNLVLAEPGRALVIDNRRGLWTTELEEGLAVLTNLDVNDPRCPRLAGATRLFEEALPGLVAASDTREVADALAPCLGAHQAGNRDGRVDPFAQLCVHTGSYGTRSSSVVVFTADGSAAWYHADGAPCQVAFHRAW